MIVIIIIAIEHVHLRWALLVFDKTGWMLLALRSAYLTLALFDCCPVVWIAAGRFISASSISIPSPLWTPYRLSNGLWVEVAVSCTPEGLLDGTLSGYCFGGSTTNILSDDFDGQKVSHSPVEALEWTCPVMGLWRCVGSGDIVCKILIVPTKGNWVLGSDSVRSISSEWFVK